MHLTLILRVVSLLVGLGFIATLFANLNPGSTKGFAARWRAVVAGMAAQAGELALKDKIDQRAGIWEQMKALMAETDGRAMTAEEIGKYDQMEAQLDSLGKDIGANERHAKHAETLDKVDRSHLLETGTENTDPDADYRDAYGSWMRGTVTPDQRQILAGRAGEVTPEMRAAGVGSGAAGGYFVPQGFRTKIVEAMKFYANVRAVAEVFTTDTGNPLPWPTVDDTANVGAILAENTQVTEQDVSIGTAQLGAYMYTSKLIRVSFQLLQDSAFDLEAFLGRRFGERIGRIQNKHFTTGTGSSQPLGIQTNATVGKTGANGQTASVTYDDLIDLIHSVDPAYRQGGRCQWMLNDLTVGAARKLKDSTNRPLWEPSLQVGQPDSLLGYALVANNDMPVMAASAKSILFGDFQAGYVIRDVLGIQTLRLEERYADYLQVGFLAFARSDATVQDASAYKAYANSAT